jgi:hypothetical protein
MIDTPRTNPFFRVLAMIWVKRRFEGADFAPYMDRLEKLMFANPTLYPEFLMVSTNTDDLLISAYYIGVPNESLLIGFDGFERVAESNLPKEIDAFHLGDQTKAPFKSRFRFRRQRR